MSSKSLIQVRVTVDCVVFGFIPNQGMQICLIKRTQEPSCGMWTLPGGFLQKDETLQDAVIRELLYDTGIKKVALKQFYTFDSKDEKQHIVVGYYGLANTTNQTLMAKVKEKNASWFPVKNLPDLAFNQKDIVCEALHRMYMDATNEPIFRKLLAETFTLSDVQFVLEEIFDCRFDKSNFRKKILESGLCEKIGKKKIGAGCYAPELYRFTKGNVAKAMGHKLFGYASFIGKLISKKFG